MASVHTVTDQSFEEDVLTSEIPVLVDFWADWCGPCKTVAPLLDELAPEYEGRLRISKVNVDSNPETPTKYAVRGIPTMLVIKNGEVVGTKVGALNKSQLKQFIDESIA